jgi:hypothetical protein
LDYAKARYDASAQGRFLSVDPLLASADSLNPQSFNRYAYCLNNPTNQTDPLGLMAGAYQNWASVQDGLWRASIPFNQHLGGPEAIGRALFSHDQNGKSKKKEDLAYTIYIYTAAFLSREDAINYYEKQFGGRVREINGRFVPVGNHKLPEWLEAYGKTIIYAPITMAWLAWEQAPDAIQINASSMWVFNANLTITKDLDVFGGVATPNVTEIIRDGLKSAKTGKITPYAASAQFVKIVEPTRQAERRAFFSGSALNVSVGYEGVVGGYIRSAGMNALTLGVGTPGVDLGTSYSRPLFSPPKLELPF